MKKALLVAINAYVPPYTLRSKLNDLVDLTNTLKPKGFLITTLVDAAATKTAILFQLRSLVTGAVPGDSIVFWFGGHGSYIAGNEPDGRTECLCPYDWSCNLITDDELAAIIALKKAGVNLDVILGNCYSGTGTRIAELADAHYKKAYCIPSPLLPGVKANDEAVSPSTQVPVPSMNHVLWAACKDLQTSYEVVSGGKYRGLFELYLCYALRQFPTKTRAQIDAVVTPLVRAVVPTQEPQLEGPASELAQLPFT